MPLLPHLYSLVYFNAFIEDVYALKVNDLCFYHLDTWLSLSIYDVNILSYIISEITSLNILYRNKHCQYTYFRRYTSLLLL